MKASQFFISTQKEAPADAEVVSHRLMTRAGMIKKLGAGIYTYMPMGLRVLRKVEAIVRQEMARAGAVELLMPVVQPAELWQESGRFQAYGAELLRIKDRHDRDFIIQPTSEEVVTDVARQELRSYKQLPKNLYHIQTKFRDERRPRFGVMRSREFLMKDAYSFDLDAAGARHSYNKMFTAYLRTFARLGLTAIPMVADTGPIGGDLSHEFIVLASTGESEVYCHRDYLTFAPPPEDIDFDSASAMQGVVDKWTSRYAATSEKHDPAAFERIEEASRISARGIEVGHIFYFGTKYSAPMKAVVNGPDGKEHAVHMGSYGIGPTRLAAALIEANHDDAGMIWSRGIAPFDVGVINLKVGDSACDAACARVEGALARAGIETLYDDREDRPGAKFATMDLIGLPHQVIVGPKGLADGKVEIKDRRSGERELVSLEAAIARLGGIG
jgi:prolyl-tRNA synthetase